MLTLGCNGGPGCGTTGSAPVQPGRSSTESSTQSATTSTSTPQVGKSEFPPPSDLAAPPADAQQTPSGLWTKVLEPGTGGKRPQAHDQVTVHHTGWDPNGKLIDSSSKRGAPETFEIEGVIPGWAEGLQLMTVGERRRLWVPDALVYPGRSGYPRGLHVFDLELVAIVDGPEPIPAPQDVASPPADAERTASGLAYKVLQKGAGTQRPDAWDRVTLEYAGWTSDGKMFDSSQELGGRATFDVDKVMPGWSEGLQRMVVGDRMRLWVPQALAYQGNSGQPKGTLVFDIELLAIDRRPQPPEPPKQVAAPPKHAQRTKSGLAYRVLRKGKGEARPTATSRVRVHYSAWTTNGKLFDSSVVRGAPASFPVRSTVAGLREGLQLMTEGDKFLFWIPKELGYGERTAGPKGMLVYETELLEVVRP